VRVWCDWSQETRRAGTLRLQQLEAEVAVAEKELERVRSEVRGRLCMLEELC
jgi:hypothetical protein